jgi:hypothetical protein
LGSLWSRPPRSRRALCAEGAVLLLMLAAIGVAVVVDLLDDLAAIR